MRQQLPDNWTLELDPAFSRRETDDGFTVFTKPGMEIWSVVYCEQSCDAEEALQSFLDWRQPDESDIGFRSNSDGIVGRAFLTNETDGWTFWAVVAFSGRILKLNFRIQDQSEVDAAIVIWHSLQHSPPSWVRMCCKAKPPLARLREALERGTDIDEAISAARDRQQIADARAVLLEALNSECATVRKAACDALNCIDEADEEVMSALRDKLDDDIVEVRAWAADALLDLGEPPASVVPSMIDGLQKCEGPMPKGEDRIQGMCGYLYVPDRYNAARILASIGEAARPARDVLLEHQMDESCGVRLEVAEALLNLGEPKSKVLPPLLDGLHSPDFSERERMRFAKPLLELGTSHDEILPVVIRGLDNASDYTAKIEALEVLSELGIAAQPAAEFIENAIVDEPKEWDIKIPAARTLMQIGGKADVACPILFAALDEDLESYERAEIIIDLGRSISLDSENLKRISKELDAEDLAVRSAAASVLARNGVDLERSLSILTEALDDSDNDTCLSSVVALGQLGSTAAQTVDQLIQLVRDDESRDIQLAGVWALGRIGCQECSVKSLFNEISQDADEEELRIIDDAIAQFDGK